MGIGTKNRLKQTADQCKEHLRLAHPGQLSLVEEFIQEIEGKEPDVAKWGQFTDLSRNVGEMLRRLDEGFKKWLRGDL